MKVRTVNDIAILAPHGWLMGGDETEQFEIVIRKLLESGNRKLLLDLAGVVHMNSTAIGMLVACRNNYVERGGIIRLCNVDTRIDAILVITKLVQLFDVYTSEREAIAGFESVEVTG